MGYSCSAALSYKVDKISLEDAKWELKKGNGDHLQKSTELIHVFNEVHKELVSKKVKLSFKHRDAVFFNEVSYYGSFTSKTSDFQKEGYTSAYEIEEHIFDSENYIYSPNTVLDLLIFSYFYSLKLPKSTLEIGIGDSGMFWADLTLKNGDLKKISHEYGDSDGEDGYGFRCSDSEMKSFFKQLKELNS